MSAHQLPSESGSTWLARAIFNEHLSNGCLTLIEVISHHLTVPHGASKLLRLDSRDHLLCVCCRRSIAKADRVRYRTR
jgi:hypothetical protein